MVRQLARLRLFLLLVLLALLPLGCNRKLPPGQTEDKVVSLELTPATATLEVGETLSFRATATFEDGSTLELTDDASWSSNNAKIAKVDNGTAKGQVTAVAVGTTKIVASGRGKSVSATVTVVKKSSPAPKLVSIAVTPAEATLALGTHVQLQATGTYSDGTSHDLDEVSWSSSKTSRISVSGDGLAEGLALGTATISAQLGEIVGHAELEVTAAVVVSIEVTSSSASVPNGTSQQLVVTGTYSDGSVQIITESASFAVTTNPGGATVSNSAGTRGLVTAVDEGSVTVTASVGGVSGTVTLTVVKALESLVIETDDVTLELGETAEFIFSGTYTDESPLETDSVVGWSSDDPEVASIDADGTLTTHKSGTVHITASLGAVTSNVVTVTVYFVDAIVLSPVDPSVAVGDSQQFTARHYFEGGDADVTEQVSWSTQFVGFAQISNNAGTRGLAQGVAQGTSAITATLNLPGGGSVSGSTDLTVTPPYVVSISVTPATKAIPLGMTQQFIAKALYNDGHEELVTQTVTWSSGTPSSVGVSNSPGSKGLATAMSLTGSAVTITARYSETIAGTASVTVDPAKLMSIMVSPSGVTLAPGQTQNYTATGIYSDLSMPDLTSSVTWWTTDPHANLSNSMGSHGRATALSAGTVTVRATLGDVTGTTTLNIQDP